MSGVISLIILVTNLPLTGANDDELSGIGARGVAHKEDVTLQVKFSPALLRDDYDLEMTLFMVCKGAKYAGDDYLHVRICLYPLRQMCVCVGGGDK